MAKYGSTLAEVKVYINGKEKAKKELEELKAVAKSYSDQMALANNQMLKASEEMAKARERINDAAATKGKDSAEYKRAVDDELRAQQAHDEAQKRFKENQTEYKKYQKLIKETEKLNVDLEEAMSRLSEQDIKHLRQLQRQLDAIRNQIDPNKDKDGTFLAYVNNALKQVTDTIKNRRGDLLEFEDIMGKLTHVDDRSLESVIKRLKDLIANTDKLDTEKLKKYKDQLAEAEDVQQRRIGTRAESVMYNVERGTFKVTITETQEAIKLLEEYKKSLKATDVSGIERVQNAIKQMNAELDEFNKKQSRETITSNLQTSGTADIKQAVDWLTKYQGTLEPLSQEWREVNAQIEAGNHRLKQLTDATKYEAMVKQFSDLNYLSTNALAEQKQYWESMRDNEEAGTMVYDEAIAKLKEISTLEADRMKRQSRETLTTGLQTSGTAEIKQAVDWLTKYQGTLEPLSQEWREVNAQIEAGNERLKQLTNQTKLEAMTAQFAKLGDLSSNAFAEQKKYWEGIRDSVAESDPLYKQAIDNLKQILDLENTRMKSSARETLTTNLQTAGTADIKQAVDWLTKYQGTLEPLSQEWREVNAQIEAGNHRLKQLTDATKYEAMVKQFSELNYLSTNALTEQKKYWESMRDNAEAGTMKYDEAIAKLKEISTLETDRMKQQSRETLTTGLQTSGTAEIKQAVDWLTKYQGTLEPLSQEWREVNAQIEAGNERLKQLTNQTKLEAMTAQFAKLGSLSSNAFAEQKKYWEGIRDSVAESDPLYKQAIDNLKQITDLENTRMKSSARETLTTNLPTSGTADIKQAVDWLTKYQGTLEPLSQEWREVNAQIEAGNERLKQLSDRTKLESMVAQFGQLSKLSKNALEEQQKYWQSVLDNSSKGTAAYIQAERKLQAISQEMTDRLDAEKGKVLNNLSNYSVSEIEEAIKATEKLRDAQKAGSVEYGIYNNEIKRAKEYLQSYVDLNKQIDMEGKWANLTTLSAGALAEQKKYWQEMVNGAQNGSQELQEYQNRLKAVTDEESRRSENRLFNVANNPDQYSTSEVEEAVKVFQKLRDEQKMGSQQWQWYADLVDKATEQLSRFKDEAKMKVMTDQFANLRDLSVNALAEQKKYWQGVYDSAQAGTAAYDDAFDKLREIRELEESRTKRYAEMDINAALSGNWNRTIEDTEKAIKLIEEYKKQLHVKSDAPAIDEANQAITILNQNLGKAKEALMDVNEAINIGKQLKTGTFDGTTEEILRAKKALEEYRKTLKQKTDATRIKQVDEALRNVANAAEQAKGKLVNIDEVLKKLDTASMEELQAAAKQLQDQLTSMERDSDPTSIYAKTAQKLRNVKAELEEVKHEWEEHDNVIIRTAKRLAAYVAVYGGFNAIAGQLRSLFDANLQLSDSFADVQKTTGLTSDAIKELSRDINSIDTRSTQAQLHELAAVAGQIGLKSQEDILGFVKASNMITVSLNELGSEGTASLMKLAQLTGEIKENGVEKSLMAIGSSINELSANSAATAGPIVDLMNRMGGIASQSNITTAELAAIGATADAIGQSMEITGTSMNKFIATLMSSSDQIAYSLNMDAKALNDLLEAGDTMEAMLMVFERMQDMGGISALAPVMKDLGSEGARMMQLLSAMAQNVGFLRNQVDLSREAFEEAISIENEYNIKNENAIALLQRMGNTLNEMWVNSTFVTGLTWILKQMNSFVSWLAEGNTGARILKTAMIMLGTAIALASMHLDSFAKALFKAKTYTDLFNKSWAKMGELLKKNWISIVAGAILALGYYIWQTVTYVSELARATNRYNAELDRENNIMKSLFNGLKQDNITHREKSKLINEINQRYGKYLDFLVSERDSVEELAAAYELANARMRESMATRMGEKQMEILDEKYGEQMAENRNDLMSVLEKGEYTAGREKEAMATIRKITMENLDKEVKDIRVLISKEFQRMFGQTSAFAATQIKNYIETQKEYHKEFAIINEEAAQDLEAAQKATADANVKVMEEMFKQVQDLSTGVTKASADGPFKSALDIQRGIVQEGEQFIEYASKNLDSLTKEQREKVDANIKLVQQQMEVARKQLPEGDPWGKEGNLKGWKETLDNLSTASVDSLVSTYRELRDAPKLITDVMKYNRMFGTSFSSLGEVMEDTHDKAEQIKNQLASMGRTTTGDFLWGQGGGGGKRPKDEFEAALASLEAYYNDREEIVRKNALLEETTQEELDKRLQSLEQEHLSARIELRKLMLSKENSFLTTFSHAAESEYMQGIDYGKLQTQLGKLGKAMSQGLEKNLTADMVTLQKIAWEHQEEISKILIENDPVKKVALEYQQSFEKIDLFWAADELRTKEAANEKMATLLEFSAKRADLNDKDMRTQLEASKQFGNVVKTMNAEEYQAFLILLDQYAEAATNAKRQATQKAIKNLEFGFDNSELGKQVSGQLKNLEEMEAQFGDLDSSGLILEATSFKKHKEFVEQRIALEQIKWNEMIETEKNGMNRSAVLQELMLERDKATYEARLEVMKLIMDMDANMFEESNSRIDQMQGWGAISEIDATERQRSLIYAELGLKQMRIDELIRIEEEGQNRMDVINNLRLAKQDALYKADRRLTELTMQEYQQRAQVAQEWGSAIGTGLGEMIAGTEDAGKTLVKNLATMAVQSIGQMAQMYVAKQLLLSQQNMSEAAAAMTTATTAAAEATAVGAAKTAEATAIAMATPDSVLTGGAAGAAKAAVISGLIAAAVAASIAIINSLFPGAGSKATASNRKLSTGMLTYESGYYPDEYYSVNGKDGKTYRAKYEGAGMKTGIYGGGAHFGIFSEKLPEMIVDGKTTQKLILNYPYIYDAITTIAKNGRLVNAMPTFASGDYPAGMNRIAQVEAVDVSGGVNPDMERMNAALEMNSAVLAKLNQILVSGQISANVDPYANNKATKRAERFMKRRGIG